MKINGETSTVSETVTLAEFLLRTGYEISKIAVEMNGEIIPKKEYGNIILHDEDTLEVVTFMGGG